MTSRVELEDMSNVNSLNSLKKTKKNWVLPCYFIFDLALDFEIH